MSTPLPGLNQPLRHGLQGSPVALLPYCRRSWEVVPTRARSGPRPAALDHVAAAAGRPPRASDEGPSGWEEGCTFPRPWVPYAGRGSDCMRRRRSGLRNFRPPRAP